MLKKIFIFCAIIISFSSCEKDDICADGTPTTPSLYIEVRNSSDIRTPIGNLKILSDKFVKDFPIIDGTYLIKIPLDVTENSSQFEFIRNFGSTNSMLPQNSDIVTINYTRKNEFVSKACGYKTTFQLNDTNTIQVNANTNGAWIVNPTVVKKNIELDQDNELHIKIFI